MPLTPITFGPRGVLRLGDLTGADVFVVECRRCRWTCRVAPWRLHLRWPADQWLLELGPALRCRRCGVHGDVYLDWRIERASPRDLGGG